MMRILLAVTFACLMATVLAESVSVVSPDGRNEIRLETEPTLAFQVFRNGRAMTELSPMSMTVEGRPVIGGAGLKIAGRKAADRTGTVITPIYKKASVDEAAKGTVVSFGEWSVELVARNDGVAWRYVTDFGDREVIVKNERIDLAFASGEQTVYATPNYGHGAGDPLQNSWEGIYAKHLVKDAPRDPKSAENGLWYAPITFLYPSGETMVVQESDIWDYPGWNFNGTADGRTLTSLFAAYPKKTVYENWNVASRSDKPLRYQRVLEREDFLARTRGTRTYPWRVFALADNVAKIAEGDIVYALASPNAIGDASWVKPGKVAWDWWNNWNLTGVDFRAGINTRTYEYYIDFAAKNGVEYVIFDEGWSQHLDVEKYNPDMDVPHLVRYANERGVGIILWAAWAQFHGRAERVVSKYAEMGVKGFKVDFMDRDDQLCYEFLRDFAALCAKYKLVVDYHGMSKPAGFARTYPNVLCFEGVQGLENLKGKTREFFPAMDCTIAFTRMAAGPLDYTPGAMRNFCRGTYHPHPNTPGSYGTRVHQMALMTVYEAPLEMLCDSPTQYLANRECFDFMRKLPVVWDETVALEGEMDAYATIARRKGADWYVGSICGWQGHETEVDTSFLGKGEWTVEIFADGINADRDAVDYAHRTLTVRAGEKIPIKLMPGGGWTAHFSPRRKSEPKATVSKSGSSLQTSPPDEDCDVAVVGGGPAGVAAALQSAAGGARTVLIEQGFQVGGTMTSGGVNFPGLFHAWGRQVIDGVGYALVTNCVFLAGGKLPDFCKPTGPRHWDHQIHVNVPLYVALAEEALRRRGVVLHYHAAPTAVVWANGCWHLEVAAVGDVRRIAARQVVDCTGGADVVALAGFPRERAEVTQPGSFVYEVDPGVDVGRLDLVSLQREYERALAEGRLLPHDLRWSLAKFLKDKGGPVNYIDEADNSTADLRTETNLRGRASMLRVYRFLHGVKGLENARLVSMSPEVGVRETYRIVGEYRVTEEDYRSGRVFHDSLCHAFYPVDLHEKTSGIRPSHLSEGVVPTVPLRALVPKGSRNLLAAGRCVSSDRGANSGLRVEAACMAMGQVAGAAAACAARRGTTPIEVPLEDIRRALREAGAIVP